MLEDKVLIVLKTEGKEGEKKEVYGGIQIDKDEKEYFIRKTIENKRFIKVIGE